MEEVVPGMAAAIESRRLERGLTPTQFARLAGLSPQGLAPVRRGERKNYQTKVKVGVARALGLPHDALDRLLAGEAMAEITADEPSAEDHARLIELEATVTEMASRLAEIAAGLDELLASQREQR